MVDPGVGHSADVYLLFNDPHMNEADFVVGHTIVDYWMNFASSGNPSKGKADIIAWPTYSSGNNTMVLRPSPAPVANLRGRYCNFWAHARSGNPPLKHASSAASILV